MQGIEKYSNSGNVKPIFTLYCLFELTVKPKKIIMIASLENVVSHSKKRNVDTQELLTSAPRHHVR